MFHKIIDGLLSGFFWHERKKNWCSFDRFSILNDLLSMTVKQWRHWS